MTDSEITEKLMAERAQLVGFLTMITGDRFAADDLFQETCLEIFRIRHKYRRDDSFGAWSRGVARIQALRYLRGRGKAAEVALSPEVVDRLAETWSSAVSSPGYDQRPQLLRACMSELDDSHRRLLTMRYFERCTYAEIADRLERSVAAVKMLSSRLRKRLRLCVELKATDYETQLIEHNDGR